MKIRYLLSFIICLVIFSIGHSQKTVVVVKKTVDKDGNVVEERIEKTGDDADKLILEMKESGELEDVDIEIDEKGTAKKVRIIKNGDHTEVSTSKTKSTTEDLEVESTVDADGNMKSTYILTTIKDGKEEVVKWDGVGEPPAAIKRALDKTDVHTIVEGDDGEIEQIWVTKEGEQMKIGDRENVFVIKEGSELISPNRATLGVMINDEGKGVKVEDVVEGSAAAQAGIESGDTILKIDSEYVFSTDGLLKILSTHSDGDEVKVTVLRDGVEKVVMAILK